VTIEEDGRKGLTLGQSGQYDIVLLDLMLPSLSGLDILKTLRDQKLSPAFHGKIVITTNLAERKSNQIEIEKQADGYLIKAAITPRQLVEFLSRIDTTIRIRPQLLRPRHRAIQNSESNRTVSFV